MFKIESYLTPLLMGYIDKYVKLKPDDFQLSLWGGDAILCNLDLRLDIIEKAVQLPIVFQSGHVHELRLHVPWTKLGYEPVVITINTIECILKLRDTAYVGSNSSASSEIHGKSSQRQKPRKNDGEDLPTGYLQSLMNKVMNNVNIIVNNLIVKFVEDDIVLSLNVKSAECYSVDRDWNRAFVDIQGPNFVLRRIINVCDLTVCLDKRDYSGKIENYQDPMTYRCSLACRLYTKYEHLHAKFPLETKLNVYCENLAVSLTDTQLPMFIRLIELCLALYYGTLEFKASGSEEQDQQTNTMETKYENVFGDLAAQMDSQQQQKQQGWASWAWSYMYLPQILPDVEEYDDQNQEPIGDSGKSPAVFSCGMYSHKFTLQFKLTESLREKAHYGPRKVTFKPFLFLEAEGISLEVLWHGITFFDAQFGITNMKIFSQGICICGAEGENDMSNVLLSGGDILSNKSNGNYICQSLFDPQSPENLAIEMSKILDFDEHRQVYTEKYGLEKFGIFWMDYLYSISNQLEPNSESNRSSASSIDDSPVFPIEKSLSRFVIGQCHLRVSSATVHRVQKLLDAAYKYEYQSYSVKEEEKIDENRPCPTEEQLKSLEEFIPTRTYHLALLQPVISYTAAEHVYCDVSKKVYRSAPVKVKGTQGQKQYTLFGIQFDSQRFDLQVTSPMYYRKLVQMVSKVVGPSDNLLYQCHSRTQMKLVGFHVGLIKIDSTGLKCPLLTIIPPTSGTICTKKLLLPMYWRNSYLPKLEHVYELPQISLSISKPGFHVVMAVISSWRINNPKLSDIMLCSLMDDVFSPQDKERRPHHLLELTLSGFEMKTCRNDMVMACTGTLSFIIAVLYKDDGQKSNAVPILSCPSNTDTLHTSEWLLSGDSSDEIKDTFLTFSYQLPRKFDTVQAPVLVLLSMEGMSCCLDPCILEWLSYTPTCTVLPNTELQVELDLELVKAASPLPVNLSQVSVPSSGSTRQTLSNTTGRHSTLDADKRKLDEIEDKQSPSIGKKLAQLFPLIRVLKVQVEVKKVCLFMPLYHVHVANPSMDIVDNICELAKSKSLPDLLVVCLPHAVVQSAGLKVSPVIQEIPITSVEGSIVGDKIPWNINLQNCAVYTIQSSNTKQSLNILPLLKPTTVSCSVGVSYKYNPPTSDNISALGLCVHTDMHSVTLSASVEQMKLLIAFGTQAMKLAVKATNFYSYIVSKLSAEKFSHNISTENIDAHSKLLSAKPAQIIGVNSVTEGSYTQNTNDVTSLDSTPSRELEFMEADCSGVKLSLWLQWTLPRGECKLYFNGKQEETKLYVAIDDITLSVDVQDVYTKLKLNVEAASINHYIRSSSSREWKKGSFEGILMCCAGRLSHDTHILSSQSWSSQNQMSHSMCTNNQLSRALVRGFFSLTFTRALKKNVKSRLQKLNVEIPFTDKMSMENKHSQLHFHKYVNELCINMAPFDVIVCALPLAALINNLIDLSWKKSPNTLDIRTVTSMENRPVVPLLTSDNLPLIYADLKCIRFFIPSEKTHSKTTISRDEQETMTEQDMFLLQVQSLNIIPYADNPLPRYGIDKDQYQQSIERGASESALADGQFQIDLKGLSITTGNWAKFVKPDTELKVKALGTPATQIPAVDWNFKNVRSDHEEDIHLFPLVSSCDLKIVLAPAIVSYLQEPASMELMQPSLVCGYGIELNVITDLDLYITVSQEHLLEKIVVDTTDVFSVLITGHLDTEPEDKELDIGIDSEVSALKSEKSHQTCNNKNHFQNHFLKSLKTPMDLLLTAGRISCTLYNHTEIVQELKAQENTSSPIKKMKQCKKQDLDWPNKKGENMTEGLAFVDNNFLDFYKENVLENCCSTQTNTSAFSSVCIQPFLFLYISQPYIVLSCQTHQQKLEMSCYDVLIKGCTEKTNIPVTDTKLLPGCSDFTEIWLETRSGRPNYMTGIPPCLFTLSVIDFLNEPASISLKFERPLKLNWNSTRFKQIQEYLDILFPWQLEKLHSKQGTHAAGLKCKKKSFLGSFTLLHSIKHIQFHTEQVIVVLETTSYEEKPGFSTSFSSFRVALDFQHNERGELISIILSSYLRDLLLKTMYNNQHLHLIDPCVLKIDGRFIGICHNDVYIQSQTIITISTGLVTVHFGQEHALCLMQLISHYGDIYKELFHLHSMDGKADETMNSSVVSVSEERNPTREEYIVHKSADDLRSDVCQYIMDSENLPKPGQIVFCNNSREGLSSMSWSYNEPRVISGLVFNPVPFNVASDSGDKVHCVLQYWEDLIQNFVDFVDIELSENEVTEINLPDVWSSRKLVVAQVWRIGIRNNLRETIMLPTCLAASVKVDSCFIPSLIPALSLGTTVEAIELRLINHVHCLGKVTPTKLHPFYMSSSYQATGEFAVCSLNNVLLASSHLIGQQARTQLQFSSQVTLDVLEYRTLTLERVLSSFVLSGVGSIQHFSKPSIVEMDLTCEPVIIRIGQGIVHNLICSMGAWMQILSDDRSHEDEVIFSHYVICNDTQQTIRYGQVGTDENLVLQPREMHQYGWRSHKIKQKLHVCLDGPVWKWSDSVDISKPGTLLAYSSSSSEQKYTLVITVRKISNVHNQVIITGLLTVSNRLSHDIEVKVITIEPNKEQIAVVGADQTMPSYVLEPGLVQGIKFRTYGSNGVWSKELQISGPHVRDNYLIKLTQTEKIYHVWCRVFSCNAKSEQVFVVLCPLYTIRSHLPYPIYLNIDTSKLNLHEKLVSPGRGSDLQLQCLGNDIHQALTFQFSPSSSKSTSSVTLSTSLIDRLNRASVKQMYLDKLYWKQETWFEWPYSHEVKIEDHCGQRERENMCSDLEIVDHPTVDLNVTLSELWPGYQTVLVDVAPSSMVNNMCVLDLVFMSNEDIIYDLNSGDSICPNVLQGSFHLGIKFGSATHMTSPVPVSMEEIGAQRYRNDVGRTLYLDSYVHMPVFADIKGKMMVCYLTLTSMIKHNIRVITIKERYYWSNMSKYCLNICSFSVPNWSKKVDVPVETSQTLKSHIKCRRDEHDFQPLTFQPVMYSINADFKYTLDQNTQFVNYLSIQNVENAETIAHGNSNWVESKSSNINRESKTKISHWSFPVRLESNEIGVRSTLCVYVCTGEVIGNVALCITGQNMNNVTYYTVAEDKAPVCYIQNNCLFPLFYGQMSSTQTATEIIVEEQNEFVKVIPFVPVGSSIYYTPPLINNKFPQIDEQQHVIPKIHISGMISEVNTADENNIKWSQPIDLNIETDNFISIPGLTDVKVHTRKVATITWVTVMTISRADVSAKEIRSRLTKKNRIIVMDSVNTIETDSVNYGNIFSVDGIMKTIPDKNTKETKSELKRMGTYKMSCSVLIQLVTLIIQNELNSSDLKGEMLRLSLDSMFLATYPAGEHMEQTGCHRSCVVFSLGDMQLDNQVQLQGNYDFSVILTRQDFVQPYEKISCEALSEMSLMEKHAVLKCKSLSHVQFVLGQTGDHFVIESFELGIKPISFYIDDTFIFDFVKEMEGLLPVPLSASKLMHVMVLKLPAAIKSTAMTFSNPVNIGYICVQPLAVLFSIHASLKLFIASDNTPLSFGKIEKWNVRTTSYQLVRAFAMHFAAGALFRAGAVVGSLEILGSPTGLIRSIGTGVADFFRMPYRGLTRGPGAFIIGVSQGTSSMVKNITTGMLKSVTNFASSVSRNMDRLSFDDSQIQRQLESRRHLPDGIFDGLKQGLTGLGISLLGAVAGIADQPLQSVIQPEAQLGHYWPTNFVTGMGKGLVGVFTKPIGGAAELVSQTGLGILQGTGLSKLPKPKVAPVLINIADSSCGQLKYVLKLLQTLPSKEILCCMPASYMDLIDAEVHVILVLTPEYLFVINIEEDSLQHTFALLELECGVTRGDDMFTIIWKDAQTSYDDQVKLSLSNTARVTAFIDGATHFINQDIASTRNIDVIGQHSPFLATDSSSAKNSLKVDKTDAAISEKLQSSHQRHLETFCQQRQSFSLEHTLQLTELNSVHSYPNIATLPQYTFKLSATRLAAFQALFSLLKNKLEGVGFIV